MKWKLYIIMYKRWLFSCLLFFSISCGGHAKDADVNIKYPAIKLRVQQALLCIDSAKQLIQAGDVITRTGTDFTSESLRRFSQTDATYSHCGIANIEHDSIFVYNAIGGELNPHEKLKREPFEEFCNGEYNSGIGIFRFDLTSPEKNKLINLLHYYFIKKIEFDMQFDLKTDDKMYCTEFVDKVISRSCNNEKMFATSHIHNFVYVAVDNIFLNKSCKQVHRFIY